MAEDYWVPEIDSRNIIYFRFKIKRDYLPEVIINYCNIKHADEKHDVGYLLYREDLCYINKLYLRKLKLQNINNTILHDDKIFLEYILDSNLVDIFGNSIPHNINYII